MEVYGPDPGLAAEDRLHAMVAVGVERTIEQDPAFAVRIMVDDLAIRALSPAVNDTTTAVQVIDHLEDLRDSSVRPIFRTGVPRSNGCGVGWSFPVRRWVDYLTLSVTEIREYGDTSIQVVRRLRAMLEEHRRVRSAGAPRCCARRGNRATRRRHSREVGRNGRPRPSLACPTDRGSAALWLARRGGESVSAAKNDLVSPVAAALPMRKRAPSYSFSSRRRSLPFSSEVALATRPADGRRRDRARDPDQSRSARARRGQCVHRLPVDFGLALLFFFAGLEVIEQHVPRDALRRGTVGWGISLAIRPLAVLGIVLQEAGADASWWLLGVTHWRRRRARNARPDPLGCATPCDAAGTSRAWHRVAGEFWPIIFSPSSSRACT